MTPTSADLADAATKQQEHDGIILAPFNPTCLEAQIKALRLLTLKAGDVLFDLGSGDGQFLIHAATHSQDIRCVGIELNPKFVARGNEARDLLPEAIKSRIILRQGDVLVEATATRSEHVTTRHEVGSSRDSNNKISLDEVTLLDDATAVFVYLVPKGMKKVKPLLQAVVDRRMQEQKQFRVVSYIFSIPGWEPKTMDRSTKADVPLYLYEFNPDMNSIAN